MRSFFVHLTHRFAPPLPKGEGYKLPDKLQFSYLICKKDAEFLGVLRLSKKSPQ